MKGSSIISALQHLRIAKDFFQDFQRCHPGTKGATLFGTYINRIEWIYKDIITHPLLPAKVVEGVKQEWSSDVYATSAIAEKAALLNPEQRDVIENLIDKILSGEEIKIEEIV